MKDKIIKTCKHHGKTEFVLRSDGYSRCKKCAVEAVTRRRRKLKQMAVEHLGGRCIHCGYNKCIDALDFHHRSGDKDFGLGSGNCKSWPKIKKELKKCDLVCANCHREIHSTNLGKTVTD